MTEPPIVTPGGEIKPPITTPEVKPPEASAEVVAVDYSKLSEEQLVKVLEDPRIWKTQRLSEMKDAQKQLKEIQDQKTEAEKEALKKKGDYETLSKQQEEKIAELTNKHNNVLSNTAIMAEAAKLGVTYLDAAIKLIDRSKITVNDDGTVSGVVEAVAALVEANPYLKNGVTTPVGGGTNPPNPNATKSTFKLSEIQDPVFYAKNFEEIRRAMTVPGAIEDDLTPIH